MVRRWSHQGSLRGRWRYPGQPPDLQGRRVHRRSSLHPQGPWSFDGALLRLVSETNRIRLAHLFDPYLAVHTSRIEPLPHQITAVYAEMRHQRDMEGMAMGYAIESLMPQHVQEVRQQRLPLIDKVEQARKVYETALEDLEEHGYDQTEGEPQDEPAEEEKS